MLSKMCFDKKKPESGLIVALIPRERESCSLSCGVVEYVGSIIMMVFNVYPILTYHN